MRFNFQIEGDTDEEKVFQEICAIIDNTIFVHGILFNFMRSRF